MKYPVLRFAQYLAFTGTSSKFTAAMAFGFTYRFVANQDCWVKVTVTGGAAAADTADNHLYMSGQELFLACDSETEGFVHVISDGTNGDATLSMIEGD